MRKNVVGLFVGLLVGLVVVGGLMVGCSEQVKDIEILVVQERSPALGRTGVGSYEGLSIAFSYPIDRANFDLNDLLGSYGSNHTAGTPDLSSATLSWSKDQKTLTVSGTKGWSALSEGGTKVVEIVAGSGKIKDIFKNEIRAGNVLWKFTLAEILPALPPPDNFSAASTTLQTTLSWDSVAEAASYNLYWSNTAGVTKRNGTKIAGVTSPYTHSGLVNGRPYYYVATAVDALNNESADSPQIAATPETIGVSDESFGTDGVVVFDRGLIDRGRGVVTDASGRVLVAGRCWNGSNYDMFIAAFNADGSPDTSFGTNGVAVYDSGAQDLGESIALDASGRILVAGRSNQGGDYDIAVLRYSAGGVLDTGFGTGGVAWYDSGNGNDDGNAVLSDASGGILVAGAVNNGTDVDAAVLRFSSGGVLDTTFGSSGAASYEGGSGNDYAESIAIDASGRILAAGYSWNGSDNDLLILRFSSTGAPDTGFGTAGAVKYDRGYGSDDGFAVMQDAAGRIFAVGLSANTGGNNDMAIWCYDASGSLDPSFGTNGTVFYDEGNGDDYAYAAALDEQGKIFATGGSAKTGGSDNMIIWRYDQNGNLDTSFGANGMVVYEKGKKEEGNALALDASGKVLAVGDSDFSSPVDTVILRIK